MTRSTRPTSAALAVTTALLLTACGGGDDTATSGSSGGGAHHGATAPSAGADRSATGNDADIAFLTGMVPHHEQAVEMSDVVLAADPPAAVAALAQQVKAAQAPEIEQMEQMLTDLGHDTGDGHASDGHASDGHASDGSMQHGGMMSDADMAELMDATGTDAARRYLSAMIAHHEGAIGAAETEVANGKYPPAVELAQQIAEDQAAEIAEMESLLASL